MTLRLPPGMTRPPIPVNPNPSLVTAQMWEFAHLVISLEPADFVFAGIFADKRGYHQTVAANRKRWPGDYSIRLAADLGGVQDKARALDVTSRSAQNGSYAVMARYGARMRAAAKARDPRVRHWREVLGQFDLDRPPEAIDFQSIVERVPDDTHTWHFHWSILAEFVALALAYEGMLSVLYGESFTSWNRYAAGDEDMQLSDKNPFGQDPSQFTREDQDAALWLMTGPNGNVSAMFQYILENTHFARLFARRAAAESTALRAVIDQLVGIITAGDGSVPVAQILAGVDERLAQLAEQVTAEQRDAVADLGEGGATQVRGPRA